MRHTATAALIMSLLATAAAVGPVRADVYRSVDAQGHVQYSDTPTPGAELVSGHQGSSLVSASASAGSSSGSPHPASPPSAAQLTSRENAAAQTDLERQKAQQAVQQDVEKERADQCKKATDDYQAAVVARRIYRTGADGEREYLTDEEAEQQRVTLRQAMQAACGN